MLQHLNSLPYVGIFMSFMNQLFKNINEMHCNVQLAVLIVKLLLFSVLLLISLR